MPAKPGIVRTRIISSPHSLQVRCLTTFSLQHRMAVYVNPNTVTNALAILKTDVAALYAANK
jgi:hypothetical protein